MVENNQKKNPIEFPGKEQKEIKPKQPREFPDKQIEEEPFPESPNEIPKKEEENVPKTPDEFPNIKNNPPLH